MKFVILVALVVVLSIIVSLITSNYYIKKFMEITDKLDKEYVEIMAAETWKIVEKYKRNEKIEEVIEE